MRHRRCMRLERGGGGFPEPPLRSAPRALAPRGCGPRPGASRPDPGARLLPLLPTEVLQSLAAKRRGHCGPGGRPSAHHL
eukprot:314990-Alexandrium_andersonii.AAC.1